MQTEPPVNADDPADGDRGAALLARLFDALDRGRQLPGLPSTAQRVARLTRDQRTRTQTVSALIGGDPGLASRLLRVANAVHYRSVAGPVASVQRAVSVMGFESVQRLAQTVALLDRVPRDATGLALREDFLHAVLAARLAAELWRDVRSTDDVQLTALFQRLGRLLMAACLPDEARVPPAADGEPEGPRCVNAAAERAAWGLTAADIGIAVARRWGWPAALVQALHPAAWPAHQPPEPALRARLTAWAANDLAQILIDDPAGPWDRACDALARRCSAAIGASAKDLQRALAAVRPEMDELATSVGLAPGHRRLAPAAAAPEAAPAAEAAPPRADRALLTRETLRLSGALLDPDSRRRVPAMALAALWRGLAARRAVFFGAAPQGGFSPAMVLGTPLGDSARTDWHVDPGRGRDLFSRLCANGAEALIDDARRPEIDAHLPAAFRRHAGARRFAVLPVRAARRTLGMIYLDRDDDAPFTLDGDELQLVRALRDQAALALA